MYKLRMVQQLKHGDKNEGANGIKSSSQDYEMVFETKDVVDLAIANVPTSIQEKQVNGKYMLLFTQATNVDSVGC